MQTCDFRFPAAIWWGDAQPANQLTQCCVCVGEGHARSGVSGGCCCAVLLLVFARRLAISELAAYALHVRHDVQRPAIVRVGKSTADHDASKLPACSGLPAISSCVGQLVQANQCPRRRPSTICLGTNWRQSTSRRRHDWAGRVDQGTACPELLTRHVC